MTAVRLTFDLSCLAPCNRVQADCVPRGRKLQLPMRSDTGLVRSRRAAQTGIGAGGLGPVPLPPGSQMHPRQWDGALPLDRLPPTPCLSIFASVTYAA